MIFFRSHNSPIVYLVTLVFFFSLSRTFSSFLFLFSFLSIEMLFQIDFKPLSVGSMRWKKNIKKTKMNMLCNQEKRTLFSKHAFRIECLKISVRHFSFYRIFIIPKSIFLLLLLPLLFSTSRTTIQWATEKEEEDEDWTSGNKVEAEQINRLRWKPSSNKLQCESFKTEHFFVRSFVRLLFLLVGVCCISVYIYSATLI